MRPGIQLDGTDEGSIYEYEARMTLMLYGDFVEGDAGSVLAIVSEHKLPLDAVNALRASADRLGYGREGCAWVVMRTESEGGGQERLGDQDLRTIIEGIDPISVIATDSSSTRSISRAYGVEVPTNSVGRMNGRRFVGLGDFPLMLQEDGSKRRAWRLLRSLML